MDRKINFIESRFPEHIAYGSSGGPGYLTDVVSMLNGCEQRNINWQQARNRYNVAPGIKNSQQYAELLAFFRICKGKARGFRFKDWSDFLAHRQLIAVADGNQSQFQLVKRYTHGNYYEQRVINKPVEGSVEVFLETEKCQEQDITVDYTSGTILFSKAPRLGKKIFANFEFDVPARFDIDFLPLSIEANEVHAHADIPLLEIRI